MTELSPPRRVVALGASNLTRGFHSVVAAARHRWGRDVEILAALGHGRSYGAPSRFLVRTLPGILQCGLWQELDRLPPATTRALVTDVGNDVLYGESAAQILDWVEQTLRRLEPHTHDIVLTDLPLFNIRRISPAKFLLFRSLFVPSSRLPLAHVAEVAERVVDGLAGLARKHGVRLFPLKPEWYGVDPIHIRRRLWRSAWQQIVCAGIDEAEAPGTSLWEAARLYLLAPEKRSLLGVERFTAQTGRRLAKGGRVWTY